MTKKLERRSGEQKQDSKKREFLKRAAYTAPAILSLQATSALAKSGSSKSPPGDGGTATQKKQKQKQQKQLKQQQRRKRG